MISISDQLQYLLEGYLLKDYRTDKDHYLVYGTFVSSYGMPSKPRDGGFVLFPPKPDHELARAFEKDHPAVYGDPPPGSTNKSWISRSIYNSPAFEVDHASKTVNIYLEKYKNHKSRRRDPDRDSVSWTILAPHPDQGSKLLELKKMMVDVAKLDPAILDFTLVGDPGKPKTVRQFLSKAAPSTQVASASTEPLVFYHGTSTRLWKAIQTKGLRPGLVAEVYGDLVPGYSEHNVYLTVMRSDAHNYASRAAVADKTEGAVIEVIVPDPAKLVPDEDQMGPLANLPAGRDLMKRHPDIEDVHFRHYQTWTSHPKAALIRQVFMNSLKSLRGGTVAYRGIILPKHLKLVQTFKPYRMKRDPSDEEFAAAMDKTQQSAKSYEAAANELIRKVLAI